MSSDKKFLLKFFISLFVLCFNAIFNNVVCIIFVSKKNAILRPYHRDANVKKYDLSYNISYRI